VTGICIMIAIHGTNHPDVGFEYGQYIVALNLHRDKYTHYAMASVICIWLKKRTAAIQLSS